MRLFSHIQDMSINSAKLMKMSRNIKGHNRKFQIKHFSMKQETYKDGFCHSPALHPMISLACKVYFVQPASVCEPQQSSLGLLMMCSTWPNHLILLVRSSLHPSPRYSLISLLQTTTLSERIRWKTGNKLILMVRTFASPEKLN